MSDKLLQKEVRLREEALKKFIDLERMLQKEESQRVEFERQLREENENRLVILTTYFIYLVLFNFIKFGR